MTFRPTTRRSCSTTASWQTPSAAAVSASAAGSFNETTRMLYGSSGYVTVSGAALGSTGSGELGTGSSEGTGGSGGTTGSTAGTTSSMVGTASGAESDERWVN